MLLLQLLLLLLLFVLLTLSPKRRRYLPRRQSPRLENRIVGGGALLPLKLLQPTSALKLIQSTALHIGPCGGGPCLLCSYLSTYHFIVVRS